MKTLTEVKLAMESVGKAAPMAPLIAIAHFVVGIQAFP